MIEAQIEQDLKSAMLARDSEKVSTLRGLKSTFLYAKVAAGTRDRALSDEEAIQLLQKESKRRQESADIYSGAGEKERTEQELREKAIIEGYLPAKLSEDDLSKIIDDAIAKNPQDNNMGMIIGEVKSKTAGRAAGADIARIVKARLDK